MYVLLNPQLRSRRLGIKKLFKSDPNVDPDYALDMPVYKKISEVKVFHSSVIHASYLQTFQSKNSPQIILHRDGTVQGYTPSGLPLQILIDTGCHKTLLNKHFYERHYKKHFQNFRKIPFHEKHSITVGNGQQITAEGMISLPFYIQNHSFEFLALIVDMLDDYDFVVGLEAAIQLESVYYMASNILEVKQRSLPLFPFKDIKIEPGLSFLINLSGNLPCTFSSSSGIIRIQPVDKDYSYNTIETEFVDQVTPIHVTNKSQQPLHFPKDKPLTFFDLRSIGYFEPSAAKDIFKMRTPQTYVTSFTVMPDSSSHCSANHMQTMDTQDPYLWLESDDPQRFQTDKYLKQLLIYQSLACQRLNILSFWMS